jgi:hypothetical protein
LRRRAAAFFLVPRTHASRNIGQKAHTQRRQRAADQPAYRARRPNCGRRLRAKRADHGGIHVLHRRVHQLLKHGGQRKGKDGWQKSPFYISKKLFHHANSKQNQLQQLYHIFFLKKSPCGKKIKISRNPIDFWHKNRYNEIIKFSKGE